MRRAKERRWQLHDLLTSPSPVSRFRRKASRVAARTLIPHTPIPLSHVPQENRNVLDLREKIKSFLASQGMIKGHSGSAPRAAEHEPQILSLSTDYISPTNSPQTPTLSISTNEDRSSLYPLRTDRYENDRRLSHFYPLMVTDLLSGLPLMHESPDSPLERSEYPEVLLPPAVPYSSTPPVDASLVSCKTSYRY